MATTANPCQPSKQSQSLKIYFIFPFDWGLFGVITLWQWALCCGWAVYIALLETCWHWDRELSCSRSGQYLHVNWSVVGKDRRGPSKERRKNEGMWNLKNGINSYCWVLYAVVLSTETGLIKTFTLHITNCSEKEQEVWQQLYDLNVGHFWLFKIS